MSADDNDDNQHQLAHDLASALQEALEEAVDDLESNGAKLNPITIAAGVQIVAHGWSRFLGRRGAPTELLVACGIQALPCSDKLVEYLESTESRFVPENRPPEAPPKTDEPQHDGPQWFMDGPKEEC